MRKVGIVFPGQGAQYVGMGKDLYDEFETARKIFAEAAEILKRDIATLCFEGPQTTLDQTVHTQTTVFTVGIAAFKVFQEEAGIIPDVMAGHSLGEYSALCAAGAITFREALSLVQTRGQCQEGAVPQQSGCMAAVMGTEKEIVEDICNDISKTTGLTVEVANYNAPQQVVISGHREAVAKAMAQLKQKGARRIVELHVSVPCHSRLFDSAAEKFEEYLGKVTFTNCTVDVIPNLNPTIRYSKENAPMLLTRQFNSPVRWQETIEKMAEMGIDTVIEIGPKRTLSGLIKRIHNKMRTLNVDDIASLRKTIDVMHSLS